jgi:hypothetical protein
MKTRKLYQKPQLIIHGDVEKITMGSGWRSFQDFFVYGISDPFGRPGARTGS